VTREDGSVRYRVPGTDGNREAAHLIADHFTDAGLSVTWHHFNDSYGGKVTHMHNVIGTLDAGSDRTFYVGGHYDSRPIAEKDPDPEMRDQPIQGANDGASAVGLVLELARVLSAYEFNVNLKFMLFDGEDGGNWKDTEWILGSTAFVADMTDAEVANAEGLILVDMVADPDARFPREGHSRAPDNRPLGDALWGVAGGLDATRFVNDTSYTITDDHVPFIEAGIPAVNVIDLREGPHVFAPTHHTHADTVDNIAPEPMHEVGQVLERFIVERYARE
jgi:glutaminyl-peptide cyclotransferase